MNSIFLLFNPRWLAELLTFGAIAGLRGTGNWATDERPKNFREYILWRNPNGSAPLTALMSKMASEKVDDPEFAWWEEELSVMRVAIAAQVVNTTTANTLSVAESLDGIDAYAFVPGDILVAEQSLTVDPFLTWEYMVVSTAATTSTIINVTRAALGTTVATQITGTFIAKVGNANAEGSVSPNAVGRNPTKLFNYLQIFKTAYEITRTAKGTRVRTGDPLKNEKKRRMFDHAVSMELAFLFGKRAESQGSNAKPLRYTGGLRSFLSTNVTLGTTTATETSFLNSVQGVFDFDAGGGNERLMMCGNSFLTSLNKLAKAGMQVRADEVVRLYGMELTRYIIPQGTFYLKTHPLMNVMPGYSKCAFIIDPAALKYRYMQDTVNQDNIQAPDADEQKGQWITECGLEVRHQKTMGFLANFYV
jgi:hypothetical protein